MLIHRKYITEQDAFSGDLDGKILLERHSDATIAVAVSTSSVAIHFDGEETDLNMISAGKGGSIASA